MKVFKAPESTANAKYPIFLAGSIEMGKAEMWQDRVVKIIEEEAKSRTINISSYDDIINPRRDDWDSSWEQDFLNPQFYQQVTWELHNIDKARHILFYFDPSTQSPITLMELGYAIGKNKRITVVCPEGFYRKGNVDVICHLHSIHQAKTLEEAINHIFN